MFFTIYNWVCRRKNTVNYGDIFNSACMNGDTECVKIMLKKNYKSINQEEGLLIACKYGKSDIVELLIDSNMHIIILCLTYAVEYNMYDTVKLLLDRGVSAEYGYKYATNNRMSSLLYNNKVKSITIYK